MNTNYLPREIVCGFQDWNSTVGQWNMFKVIESLMWEGGWASLKVLILCQESICSRGPFCSFFLKGDKTKSNFCFSHNHLTELRFTSGDLQFPSPAFTPDYTNDNFGREYGSLFSPGGAIGISFKSDWGLARITEDTYKDNMCLYRTSFLRNVVHSMEYDQTHLEPRCVQASIVISSLNQSLQAIWGL